MRIYNLFPLLAGPFCDWEPHLARAAAMGFDWIFVNPVQKPGFSGSLYSIKDYFALNPRLVNRMDPRPAGEQLRAATARAEALGLRMMVDLVVNHCAVDSALVREHPAWFVRNERGEIAHPWCMENDRRVEWVDLALLDHARSSDREGLYRYCVGVVESLLALGFQGFRCDAAYQLPYEFWERLIREVRGRHPGVAFVAETLGCTPDQTRATARAGFDCVFNSSKWWDFQSPWLMEQYNLVRETTLSISFPESHDTPRLAEELHGHVPGLKQRYFFAALFAAGVMIPVGFEFGFRRKLDVVQTRPSDWEAGTGVDLREYITRLNRIKAQAPMFQEECPTQFLPVNNANILLMWKASARTHEEALVILNKDIWNNQAFYVDDLRHYIQAGAPLVDASPETPLEFIPKPFHYDLLPGQGRVLMTRRA